MRPALYCSADTTGRNPKAEIGQMEKARAITVVLHRKNSRKKNAQRAINAAQRAQFIRIMGTR